MAPHMEDGIMGKLYYSLYHSCLSGTIKMQRVYVSLSQSLGRDMVVGHPTFFQCPYIFNPSTPLRQYQPHFSGIMVSPSVASDLNLCILATKQYSAWLLWRMLVVCPS